MTFSEFGLSDTVILEVRLRLTNIWQTAFPAVPIFFIALSDQWHYVVKTHIPGYVEILHELPLLPNNGATETFLHKLGALRSVDWIFITGVPIWR